MLTTTKPRCEDWKKTCWNHVITRSTSNPKDTEQNLLASVARELHVDIMFPEKGLHSIYSFTNGIKRTLPKHKEVAGTHFLKERLSCAGNDTVMLRSYCTREFLVIFFSCPNWQNVREQNRSSCCSRRTIYPSCTLSWSYCWCCKIASCPVPHVTYSLTHEAIWLQWYSLRRCIALLNPFFSTFRLLVARRSS